MGALRTLPWRRAEYSAVRPDRSPGTQRPLRKAGRIADRMMIVGRMGYQGTVLRAGYAFERLG